MKQTLENKRIRNGISVFKLIVTSILILITNSCKKDDWEALSDTESSRIKIGLYLDYGVWDECNTSTQDMLNDLNCNYTILNKDSVLNGNLNRYDLFIMPGGDMWIYKDSLSLTGMNKIKEFVSNGGGYIGICGGAYFAASTIVWRGWADEDRRYFTIKGLGLFSGTADGPIESFAPSYEEAECKIEITDTTYSLGTGVPDVITPFYSFGPNFLPDDTTKVSIIGKKVSGDSNLIIACEYNMGRVLLSSTHFEFDETYSSWALLKNAIIWCSNN